MKYLFPCLVLCLVLSIGSIQFKPQSDVRTAICANGETEAQGSHAVFECTCSWEVTGWDWNPSSLTQVCAFNHYA